MGTEPAGDIKGILDNHYWKLTNHSYSGGPLGSGLVLDVGASGEDGSKPPVFVVNLICDNVERYVLSDIQLNGRFTAEHAIVAGFTCQRF